MAGSPRIAERAVCVCLHRAQCLHNIRAWKAISPPQCKVIVLHNSTNLMVIWLQKQHAVITDGGPLETRVLGRLVQTWVLGIKWKQGCWMFSRVKGVGYLVETRVLGIQ